MREDIKWVLMDGEGGRLHLLKSQKVINVGG